MSLVLFLGILFLSACSTDPEVIKLHDESSRVSEPYQRLLVVGVSNDRSTRMRLESLIRDELTSQRHDAVAAYDETGLTSPISQDEINSAVKASDADGILITHIASVDTQAYVEPGRIDSMMECRGGDPTEYFLYDRKDLQEPNDIRMAHTVVMITSLYDVSDGSRIWTIQSTCFDKSTMNEALEEEASAIVRQLQFDNLVG